MPQEWAEGILLCELADEPELSEEFSAVFSRIKGESAPADGPSADGASGSAPAEHAADPGPPAAAPHVVPPHVVLNFQGVTYLNSSHIAQLLRMRKLLQERRRKLVLCAMNDEVWSMMLLTGLDKVFTFVPDTMTALASVQIEP